ncbi:unnamed protein product [Acanthoscelides obtectus]|uniref:Uncharacterized protein n=1 Tax=Acanthoscelides obtectus TaxID=200917 RepID=A0A9P0KLB0_ACAOB|nr:unnamed protein product [Acanthoscelides obtectus]CAK1677342.1 hypothetical protein AOBTE_LOCUS31256 [Acanthoscelides obtectus]
MALLICQEHKGKGINRALLYQERWKGKNYLPEEGSRQLICTIPLLTYLRTTALSLQHKPKMIVMDECCIKLYLKTY